MSLKGSDIYNPMASPWDWDISDHETVRCEMWAVSDEH